MHPGIHYLPASMWHRAFRNRMLFSNPDKNSASKCSQCFRNGFDSQWSKTQLWPSLSTAKTAPVGSAQKEAGLRWKHQHRTGLLCSTLSEFESIAVPWLPGTLGNLPKLKRKCNTTRGRERPNPHAESIIKTLNPKFQIQRLKVMLWTPCKEH